LTEHKRKNHLFIFSAENFVSVAFGGYAFWPPDFEVLSLAVAAVCKDCGEVNFLHDEEPEETESHEREMGSEVYYAGQCIGECGSCGLEDLSVEVQFTVYANQCEFFDYRENNCIFTNISGYDRTLTKIRDAVFRSYTRAVDEEALAEWVRDPAGCAVFVEGDDDQAVVDEFLKRSANLWRAGYAWQLFKGMSGGGKEQAVRSANYVSKVSKRIGRSIPYLIVVDGDAKDWLDSQDEIDPKRLFLLSEKEIDSYLLQPKAIAEVFDVAESVIQTMMPSGGGKEQLESLIRRLGFQPRAEVKRIIARHVEPIPPDFIKMFERIQEIRSTT
jgi:hypothetical protein